MTSDTNQPRSDEADREKETSPAGVARDLEQKAEELGATTDPEEADESSRSRKGT
jgi:hypothetical protein